MLSGVGAIDASGIVRSHVEAFKDVAARSNAMILVRGVNPDATPLIEENYATKNLHVKGKSANWGPQAGFICVDQELGKAEGNAPEVARLNAKVAESFHEGFSREAPLILSADRIERLQRQGTISVFPNPGSKHGVKKILAQASSEKRDRDDIRRTNFEFYAVPYAAFYSQNPILMNHHATAVRAVFGLNKNLGNGKSAYVICYSKGRLGTKWKTTWKLLCVVATPEGLPLTADYDLYAVCPKLALNGGFREAYDVAKQAGNNKMMLRTVAGAITHDLIGKREPDPDLGRMSARLREMKDQLNAAAQGAGYRGGNVIHHGVEVDNLDYTERLDTVTVITPGRQVYVVNQSGLAPQELENVVRDLSYLGYVFYTNRSYNKEGKPSFHYDLSVQSYNLRILQPTDAR